MLKDVFDIDSFQSFFEKGGWFSINENLQSVLNALINLVFGLIKYMVLALDYVIEQLFSLNLLDGILPDLFSTAGSIYNQLFSVLGILLFTFVIIISVKDFFEKGISKALIRFGVFTLIYAGSMAFFSDGAAKVQEVNTISQNVQGQLVDLTSGSLNSSNQSTMEKLLGGGQQLDGTSNIRNLIFDEFIIKPYALLNFGETDLTKEQFELYLVKKGEAFDKAKTKEIEKKIKEDSEKKFLLNFGSYDRKSRCITKYIRNVTCDRDCGVINRSCQYFDSAIDLWHHFSLSIPTLFSTNPQYASFNKKWLYDAGDVVCLKSWDRLWLWVAFFYYQSIGFFPCRYKYCYHVSGSICQSLIRTICLEE